MLGRELRVAQLQRPPIADELLQPIGVGAERIALLAHRFGLQRLGARRFPGSRLLEPVGIARQTFARLRDCRVAHLLILRALFRDGVCDRALHGCLACRLLRLGRLAATDQQRQAQRDGACQTVVHVAVSLARASSPGARAESGYTRLGVSPQRTHVRRHSAPHA